MLRNFLNLNNPRLTFWMWGTLDAIYIALYVVSSVREGKIPYVTDLEMTIHNLVSHGGTATGVMIGLSWLLQLSIIFSAVLLLLSSSKARLLCYIQTPFRILFMVPSVPIITYFVGEVYGTIIFLMLLLTSEVVKVYSIWRFAK
ncbi:hypothetical protein [Marinimicrobium sp. ARAG 43.8]|uniref:hypothetical protein n=1 Tax=Marinimicrobium sp. ARAG 43.8 TaxID=3418719 RepID=UPI003CF35594